MKAFKYGIITLLFSVLAIAGADRIIEAQFITNDGATLTVPDTTDTLVGRDTSDTLTNKTIDGSVNTLTNVPTDWSTPIDSNITVDTDSAYSFGTLSDRLLNVFTDSVSVGDLRIYNITNPEGQLTATLRTQGELSPSSLSLYPSTRSDANATAAGTLYLLSGARTSGTAGALSGDVIMKSGDSNQGSGNILIESGEGTAEDSGDISLVIGTAGGTQGDIKLLKTGVAPTVGDVWTATGVDGAGYWATPTSGGDLWSDPVDANIVPDADNTRSLGSVANYMSNVYVRNFWMKAVSADDELAVFYNSATQALFTMATDGTTPSGSDVDFRLQAGSAVPATSDEGIALYTRNQTSTTTDPTGQVRLETGNQVVASATAVTGGIFAKTGNSIDGASGNIELETGTPTGTGSRGDIVFKDGSEGTVGHVWTSTGVNGEGNWAAPSGGGITWSTPVDSNITLDADETYNLAEPTASFNNGYFKTLTVNRNSSGGGVSLYDNTTLSYIMGAGTQTSPSGSKDGAFFRPFNNGDNFTVWTQGGGSTASGSIYFETGNQTGTADSGDFSVLIGTSTATQGDIKFLKSGNAPTVGDVWTATGTDGSGYWAAASGGGNSWSDPVDAVITPDGDGTRDFGTNTAPFSTGYLNSLRIGDSGSDGFITLENGSGSVEGEWELGTNSDLPSGASSDMRLNSTQFLSNGIGIYTQSQGSASGAPTGPIRIETGNKPNAGATASTGGITLLTGDAGGSVGDSGDITLQTGTSANGSNGDIIFLKEGNAPANGDVWTSDGTTGSGYWATPAGSAPNISGSTGTPDDITAAGGISFSGSNYTNIAFIQGDGGAVDITADPQIAAGTAVGQRLTLIGRNDTNTVRLEDGTGLSLNGAAVLALQSAIDLMWDGTVWVEVSRR